MPSKSYLCQFITNTLGASFPSVEVCYTLTQGCNNQSDIGRMLLVIVIIIFLLENPNFLNADTTRGKRGKKG